jgi:hypothetical protein
MTDLIRQISTGRDEDIATLTIAQGLTPLVQLTAEHSRAVLEDFSPGLLRSVVIWGVPVSRENTNY